jgi:hypothetical protein
VFSLTGTAYNTVVQYGNTEKWDGVMALTVLSSS